MTFSRLAEIFKSLETTSSRLAMTVILSDLFRQASQDEIGKICYLLLGRVVPLYEAVEFGIADKLMIRAIAKALDTDESEVTKEFKITGDLGKTAENLKLQNPKQKTGTRNVKVTDMYLMLSEIARTAGAGSQEMKIAMLAELLTRSDPLSARYLVRIPLDKLRLGFSDMTILDALSWMETGDKSNRTVLEDAYNVRPDIGYIAERIREKGIRGLAHVRVKVGAPILASLCQRLPSADEMIEKMGKVAVEPKYDGMRVQIHFRKSEVKSEKPTVQSYSRNLENTTAMFPELSQIGSQINADSVILDSEVVSVDPETGRILPFQETTTRKRKHDVDLFSSLTPIRFYVFDILHKDGQDLLNNPLSDRREILSRTLSRGKILEISPQTVTDSAAALRAYHDEQIGKGLEGAVVKKWDSPYEPGRRGYSWVKFKEDEGKTGKLADTIDCIIMGYYRGEGKRSTFGIGAFLVGVRNGESVVTVTKIGTGVTDAMWHDIYRQLEQLKSPVMPKSYRLVDKALIPDIWTIPKLVVEVAGDDLTKSPNHGAGIAIRFPRLVRIRNDKSPKDATSVSEIQDMYKHQKGNHT